MMEVTVVIPSKGRDQIIAGKSLSLVPNAIVTVDEAEMENYARIVPEKQLLPHPSLRSLGAIRNWIMDNVPGEALVMMDDDIEEVWSYIGLRIKRYRRPEDIMQILENAAEIAAGIGVQTFGFNQAAKIYTFKPHDPFEFDNWVGSVLGIVSRGIRWDELLSLHPDIDYCLQNLLQKRIIFRDNRYHFYGAKRLKALGGNSLARSAQREEKEIELIKKRWGKYVENKQAGSLVSKSSSTTTAKQFYVKRRQ